jgi:hypothetical protein
MAKPDFSRRQALLRVGAAGAAAGLALPVIKSIAAPAPASAFSVPCGNEGGGCGTWDTTADSCVGGAPCCNLDLICAPNGPSTQGTPCICFIH